MEITHSDLVEIGYKWVLNNTSCGVAFKELKAAREIPDVIGFGHCQSILIEAKVSRSDFLSDAKKPHRQQPEKGMGMFRFYIAPKGLIRKDELPGKHEIEDEDDLKRVVDKNSEMLEAEGEDRLVISQATACLIV